MKRYITAFAVLALCFGSVEAKKPVLKFDDEKNFKLIQFTDMHLDPSTPERLRESEKTFARLGRAVHAEKPSFLMFTGDIVTGGPASQMWNRLIDSLDTYKIPFCIVLGNHDAEQDLTRRQIAEIVTSSPYSLNELDKSGELADMELPVIASQGNSEASVIYCLDSHDYSTIENIEGYGWFYPEQVQWMRERTAAMTSANGGKPLPSLAFFHIALKEYVTAYRNPENTSIGRAAEDECPGAVNTGMCAAMLEGGSVMGVFVGHDHDIDYIVEENGLAMGYGRFSGSNTTYNNLRPGVRVIVMKEKERGFRSWIREDDGRLVDNMVFSEGKVREL